MVETVTKVEILEDKKIKVVPIVRPRAFFSKNHDGEFMYTGCRRIYGLPYSAQKRSFFNPFLKKGEQEAFEVALNQKPGSLSLYDMNSKFWSKFTFTMTKDDFELDLTNPTHALIYRIMLVNPKFANDENTKDVPECEYMIVDKEEEAKVVTAKVELQDKAMDFMYKLKKSKAKMYDVLRLLNKKPDKDATIDVFKKELYSIINETGNIPGVTGIKQFIEVMEDTMAETKIFVLDAIDKGEILQGTEGYRIADGREFIGRDLQNVYDYFNQGTPEVKQLMQVIKTRLKN